jgi:hypothetical protein
MNMAQTRSSKNSAWSDFGDFIINSIVLNVCECSLTPALPASRSTRTAEPNFEVAPSNGH